MSFAYKFLFFLGMIGGGMKSGVDFGYGGIRHIGQNFRKFRLAAIPLLTAAVAFAAPMDAAHEHHHHHHHDHAAAPAVVARSQVDYKVPNVKLVRQDGQSVALVKEIDDGRPVILNFIYTSCTAICPVSSQIMSAVQSDLAKKSQKVHLVSISIDPEFDTPERLRKYAKSYSAQADWQFYTGSLQNSLVVQKAFDAYRGDKMNHLPLTFIRLAPGKPWVRLDGFASPEQIVREYQALVGG